jgi:lipid II:glycine glycyltransferase (peptidoglycan interpeptide bridge formation enzyme)
VLGTRAGDPASNVVSLRGEVEPLSDLDLRPQHGVKVARSDDVDAFYALVTRTANDDGFQSHGRTHYVTFLRSLPESFLLLATHESAPEPIAGLIGVVFGRQGIYYYGASDRRYKALMAPYVLQWAAIQHCKAQECTSYDLFGIAPEGSAHDPWAGITDFKKKFGGKYIAYAPERAVVLRPFAQSLLALKRRLLR